MTTIMLGDRETAAEYQAGDWVAITSHPKGNLVGQVVRVRSITGSGLLVVDLPGKLEGELVSPKAVRPHEGEPPAREPVPLADELPRPAPVQPQGLDDDTWQRIRAEAAPAIAAVTGKRAPAVVVLHPESAVEELAEPPVLLDEAPATAWDAELARLEQRPSIEPRAELPKRRGRPPLTEAEKARRKAERGAAKPADAAPRKQAAEIAQRRADELTAKAEPERLVREAAAEARRGSDEPVTPEIAPEPPTEPVGDPPRAARELVPTPPRATVPALVPAFDLTQGARQLLMDALAAREPVVRLSPLIDWLQQLEQGAS